MTEDDTFRVLAERIPFYEMMKIYRSGKGPKYPNNQSEQWSAFLARYGWTWKEFSKQWKEWNGGQGTYSDFEKSKMK
jgi:hypothetical protein